MSHPDTVPLVYDHMQQQQQPQMLPSHVGSIQGPPYTVPAGQAYAVPQGAYYGAYQAPVPAQPAYVYQPPTVVVEQWQPHHHHHPLAEVPDPQCNGLISNTENDGIVAIALLVLGFLMCWLCGPVALCFWVPGAFCLRSRNATARLFAAMNAGMATVAALLCLISICGLVVWIVIFSSAAVSSSSSSSSSSTTTTTTTSTSGF